MGHSHSIRSDTIARLRKDGLCCKTIRLSLDEVPDFDNKSAQLLQSL